MRKIQKNLLCTVLLIFMAVSSYGQLPNFTLNVTFTHETCTTNGTMNFTVSGTNPAANITYTIYLLPDTTNPYRTVSTNTLSGLSAGNYRVVATQSLGTANNSQQKDVTLLNQVAPLEFNMGSGTNNACGSSGVITVTVTSGTATGYEIISGPITRPLQTSNVFTNLVAGNYLVRVHDACGNAASRSHSLVVPAYLSNGLSILTSEFPDPELPDCGMIKIGHFIRILPNYYVAYPLTFRYTVYPSGGGAPIVVTSVVNGSSGVHAGGTIPAIDPFTANIPYGVTSFTYDVELIDGCGNRYTRNGNVVNKQMTASISLGMASCGKKFLKVRATNFTFPIKVDFLTFPAGFNPSAFNPMHPNFNSYPEYGSPTNPVPEGTYSIRITDGCNRTSTASINVINQTDASAVGENSCEVGGSITAGVTGSRVISAIITVAPPGFAFPLEYNASSYITSQGIVVITGIIIAGDYVLKLKDECNNEYTEPVTVPGFQPPSINFSYAGSCRPGFGSIYMGRNPSTSNLVSVIFTSVPANYPANLPRDVSSYIRGSYLMMDGLPIGVYQATFVDQCNISVSSTFTVREYVGNTTVTITERCSSFDMFLSHSNTNNVSNLGYWLQKYNPVSGQWGHPFTGIPYVESTIPSSSNSITLTNSILNNNLGAGGKYRVLTASSVFASPGSPTFCLRVLREFETGATPVINQVLSSSCSGNLSDVLLDVTSSGPLTYKILEKNNLPFPVDNLNNPLFTGLQVGVYLFQVEDLCGNRSTIRHDVSAPFVFSIFPSLCNATNSTLSVPNFSYLRYEWYKQGQESVILSRTSILNFIPLNLSSHAGIYHVRIIYPSNTSSCLNQTLTYTINAGNTPNAGNDNSVSLCTIPTSINLFDYLSGTTDLNGTWQQITPGGILTGNAWDLTGVTNGLYQFKYSVNGFCGVKDEATIRIQLGATIAPPILNPVPAVCVGEPVNISISNINLLYTYSWTGPNGFTSNLANPVFPEATLNMAGVYSVTAYLSVGACASTAANVTLAVNPLPEFHFENNAPSICELQNITLSTKGDNFDENLAHHVWYHEGNEIFGVNSSEIEVNQPGFYKAIVTANGCSSQREIRVERNVAAFAVGTKVGCENELYMLSAFALDNSFDESNVTYEWTGPNNFTSTAQTVDVSGLDSGDYKVVVTNDSGCKAEAIIYVRKAFCKIPKGVSPNGDGANDTWDLSGLDIHKVKIFNRYGTEVYEHYDYIDNWFGQAKNGNLLPSATYYYYIKFRSGHEKTGWVYLNREVN